MRFKHKILKISLLLSFIACSLSSYAIEQTITLTSTITDKAGSLVTMGIPFAPGQLRNEKNIRIYDDAGQEVAIFVKPTLQWHFKHGSEKTIRAVMVQFIAPVNQSAKKYSFSYNTPRSIANTLAHLDINSGTHISRNPLKANVRTPNIISVLSSKWLEQSQIIPPFVGMQDDEQKEYWNAQFFWAKDLDYTKNNIANWLFDRVTSLYKGCMRTENVSCYQEAFQSYDFWMRSINRDGDLSHCLGGSLIGGQQKACDTKYTYLEQIKLHVALTGDNSMHSNQLVDSMAELSRKQFYYQGKVDKDYSSQDQWFTERAAGIKLLTQVAAYELTGSNEALESINLRINALYGHQLSNPDPYPLDGSWRHSWNVHEGAAYTGDDNKNDRRFSPWMTENIIDGLWQAYQVTQNDKIPSMLLSAAKAINNWGFADSIGYRDKFGNTLHHLDKGASWHSSCNVDGTTSLYSASSTSNYESLIKTQNSEGWYSDSHNPELILPLALGVYFSEDVADKKMFLARINLIKSGYLNPKCGSDSRTPRKFNWNNRGNAWGTYLWVMNQDNNSDFLSVPADIPDETSEVPDLKVIDDFDHNRLSWKDESDFNIIDGKLHFDSKGKFILNEYFGLNYEMSMDIKNDSGSTLSTGILINTDDKGYYSVRLKNGPWGGAYIYHHQQSWDLGGTPVANINMPIDSNVFTRLSVKLDSNKLSVFINKDLVLELTLAHNISAKGHGLIAFAIDPNLIIDNVEIKA